MKKILTSSLLALCGGAALAYGGNYNRNFQADGDQINVTVPNRESATHGSVVINVRDSFGHYQTFHTGRNGILKEAWVSDLGQPGQPVIILWVQQNNRQQKGDLQLIQFDGNHFHRIGVHGLDRTIGKGYRGRDEFRLVGSTLQRQFPIYQSYNHQFRPSGTQVLALDFNRRQWEPASTRSSIGSFINGFTGGLFGHRGGPANSGRVPFGGSQSRDSGLSGIFGPAGNLRDYDARAQEIRKSSAGLPMRGGNYNKNGMKMRWSATYRYGSPVTAFESKTLPDGSVITVNLVYSGGSPYMLNYDLMDRSKVLANSGESGNLNNHIVVEIGYRLGWSIGPSLEYFNNQEGGASSHDLNRAMQDAQELDRYVHGDGPLQMHS